MKDILSKRMRELRIEKNLTATQMAVILNIDRSNYSKYELGKLEPNCEMIVKLAKYFGVRADYLFGLED